MSVFTHAADAAIRQGLRTDLKGKHRHFRAASFRGQVVHVSPDPHREGHHLIALDRLWTWRREEIPLSGIQTISVPSAAVQGLDLKPSSIITFEAQVRFNTGHAHAAVYAVRYEKDGTLYLLGLHYAMRLRRVFPPLPLR
jgi:hypothetical protein